MNLLVLWVVIGILAGLVCLFAGREFARWLCKKNEILQAKKRSAQVVATELRDFGLERLPAVLDNFATGNINDLLRAFDDLAKLILSGSDVIENELEETYEKVLTRKMATPQGMALIKAKIAEVEKPVALPPPAAPVAAIAPPARPAAPTLEKFCNETMQPLSLCQAGEGFS